MSNKIVQLTEEEVGLVMFCLNNLTIKGTDPNAIGVATLCKSISEKLAAPAVANPFPDIDDLEQPEVGNSAKAS